MPTKEQYRDLKRALRGRKKEFDAAVAAQNETARREAVLGALRALVVYLYKDTEIVEEGLLTVFGAVDSAVVDIGCGAKKVALFEPESTNETPASTKPTRTTQENTQGMFAFALELLRAGKMGIDPAAKWIVGEARKLGIVDEAGCPIDAKRIISWRKEIRAGRAPSEARETFDGMHWIYAEILRSARPEKRDECKAVVIGILKSSRDLAPQTAPRRTRRAG